MENVCILPLSQKLETVPFSKMVNKLVHDRGAPHPRTWYVMTSSVQYNTTYWGAVRRDVS